MEDLEKVGRWADSRSRRAAWGGPGGGGEEETGKAVGGAG